MTAGGDNRRRTPTRRPQPVIVSASRRTDIPQFYGTWFTERRRAGEALFRTAFGTAGRASLRAEDVGGYLFWTKYAGRFHGVLDELRAEGVPFAFQYTVNAYGPAIERRIPRLGLILDDICAVRSRLPARDCLEWRYDPIVVSREHPVSWHAAQFDSLSRALRGVTKVVNVSIVEPYVKTVRRMEAASDVRYRQRDATRQWSHATLEHAGSETALLLRELTGIALASGIELRACCNPEWGITPSQCVSEALFDAWGDIAARIRGGAVRPSRPGCRCLAVVDIGMDNTCVGGCRYCYVTVSDAVADRNHARHRPNLPSLR